MRLHSRCVSLRLPFPSSSTKPFMKIRKAVFPVAGLGTRVLPATKAMPKEMLTVVDRPLIQHVRRRGAGSRHRAFRFRHRPQQGRHRGPFRPRLRTRGHAEGARQDKPSIDLLADQPEAGATSFTRQQAPLGLGHAVWCARDIIGNEPFAVLLPDMIWCRTRAALPGPDDRRRRSAGPKANMVAVEEVPQDETHQVRHRRRRRGHTAQHRSRSTAWSRSRRRERRRRTSSSPGAISCSRRFSRSWKRRSAARAAKSSSPTA